MKSKLAQKSKRVILTFVLFLTSFFATAQEYLYGLTKAGGYYDMGVAYQITTAGTGFVSYGSFDGKNGGNPGNNSGFCQIIFQDRLTDILSALTVAGNQNLNHGMRIDVMVGQGGLLQPFNFLLSEDGTGYNPPGKFLLAADGQLYGLTSTEGLYNGGALFSKTPLAGPHPEGVVSFDGVANGRSPKGSLVQGPSGLIFGMTEFGGSNDRGVIFSYNVFTREFNKIHDFNGAATGANPTGSLVFASDGKLYGMARAGGTSNEGVVFRINTDGTGFTKLIDLSVSTGTAPLGSLIQHSDGNFYGMTSTGGSSGFGTVFRLSASGVFTKLLDFTGGNGKSPVGDLVSSVDGQTMFGVTYGGGVNDKGVLFKLENGNQFTLLYNFTQPTGSNPVGSLLMRRKFPAMTFADVPELTATSAPFTPEVQVPSGLPVYLVSHDPTVAIIENNKIKPVASGGVSITAYVVGNHEYLPRTVTKVVNITKSNQTIDFPPIAPKTFGDGSFLLSATSDSGLPVRFSTTSFNDVVSSDGTNWFIQNAGRTTIVAIQDGNSIYDRAEISRELIVNRKDQTITFISPGDKICCQQFAVTATSSAGLGVKFKTSDWAKLSISSSVATIHGLGPVQITAYNDGSRNYTPTETSHTINLLKGSQAIFFSLPSNSTYRLGQGDVFVNVSTTSSLPITFTSNPPGIAVIEGSMLRLLGVGTTTITATQTGSDLMNPATPVTRTVTVEPPLIPGTGNVISFGTLSTRYVNDTPFNLTAASTSGLPVSYFSSNTAVAEVVGNLAVIKGQGTTIITATQSGDGIIPPATSVQRTLTIEKRFQNIALNSFDFFSFGISPFHLPSKSSVNLPLTYQTSNASIAYVDANYMLHIVSSGSAVITASQVGNSAFHPVSLNYNISIAPLSQSVTFAPLAPKTFGDAPFTLSAIASSGLPIQYTSSNPQVATISGSTVTITGAGATTIKARQSGFPGYSNSEIDRVLTVNKASQQVVFSPLPEKKFSDYPFTLTANSSVNLPIAFSSSNPAVASVAGNRVLIHGAGKVNIVASQAGNANYLPAEFSQELNITDGAKTFDIIGATTFGGQNSSGTVFTLKTDGSNFSSLKTFDPRTSPLPQNGFIKASDGRIYGNFQMGGANNFGAIARLEADGSNLTIIHSYAGGRPSGNILQASDGYLYGTTLGGSSGGGTIFKIKPDGSAFATLHTFKTMDGTNPVGGVIEASNGKLYGMTAYAGFYNYGTIFSINKDGSSFNIVFRFDNNGPLKTGFATQGELLQGNDGYLYGALSSGGDLIKGVIFKILPDGSDFTKIVIFDGAAKGSNPFGLMIGSDGKIYGVTNSGGTTGRGTIFAVNDDGSNFTRIFDFDGASTGGAPAAKLTEGSDGLLYGMTVNGGINNLGTVYKVKKDGTGFQKLIDLNSAAASPLYGPLLEAQPGKFMGMASSGGAGNGGAIFSITSGGSFSVVKDFPQVESVPVTLIADPLGEFYYGIASSGKSSIFRISPTGQYSVVFELPAEVYAKNLLFVSTGHIWCIGEKDFKTYIFRIKPDGSGFEPLSTINDNVSSSGHLKWLTERSDGTIFGISTKTLFTVNNDGTGFTSRGITPNDEFTWSGFLKTSEGDIYGISLYSRSLYRIKNGFNEMQKITVLPAVINQGPIKLIELNGGRIGAAMIGGHVFSVNKDGSQFFTIMQADEAKGSYLQDMLQTFDGWIYVSAAMGGQNKKGVIYRVLPDGSSYQAIHSFNGSDGNEPNNIIFKKLTQTLSFDRLESTKVNDPPLTPVASSSSGGRISFLSSNPAVAVIEDDKIRPLGFGSTTITARIPANANYFEVSVERDLFVDKRIQTISFINPGNKVVGVAPFDLVASTEAGLDVSFEALTSNISINGKITTVLGPGLARIRATQSGNATYHAATPIEISFCISPQQPSIVRSGNELTSSNVEGNQWYLNDKPIARAIDRTLTVEEPGVYTVISTVEGCSSQVSNPLTVIKGQQTISFINPGNKEVGFAPFDLVASSQSGLEITFQPVTSNMKLVGKTVTIVNAGMAGIKATQNGSAMYHPANPVQVTFCISPGKPTIAKSGSVLSSSNAEGNQWYLNNSLIEGASGRTYAAEESGVYTVISTIEGCASQASDPITLVITAVNDVGEFIVNVFPNPIKDAIQIHVNNSEGENLTFELYDCFGRLIGSQRSSSSEAEVDAKGLSNGLYLLKVRSARGTVLRRILKD